MPKVIDFHVHIGTRHNWTSWVTEFFRQNNPFYYERFIEEITPRGVIDYLVSQGVARAAMLSEYAPETSGVVPNEHTAQFCAGHEELIPIGSICHYSAVPFEEQARKAVENHGVKGFKLLPSYVHFFPNDPMLFPFYDYVQSKGLPVMFHTGSSIFNGSRIKYADPLLLDDVAGEFPRLKIIMEHGGRPFWYDRAAWMISRHSNVYIGIAGMPTKNLPELFPRLEQYQDRFVFGSDWPGILHIRPMVDRVLALPLSDEVKEKILFRNGELLLGGD